MPRVVGVAFKPVTKIYHFDPAGHEDLKPGERVVVDTSRGRTLGQVVFAPCEVPESEIGGLLKPVIRRATAWDMVQDDQMVHKEAETLAICRQRAKAQGMGMKIVKVEYSFDGSSVVVYFAAEQRVDFRNLVHDLAQVLRTRVEMRQVGVRDEAKFIEGFGRCGRQLCCASWLRDFTPVSIKMAKQQDLPLNSSEVSGLCGRLLCCLSYENDFYTEARRQMPRINSILMTPQGPGKVKQLHVLRNSVMVQVEGPNDTMVYVEVPLPEPVFSEAAPGKGCSGCPAASPAAERTIEEPEALEELDQSRGAEPASDQQDGSPSGQRRRARSRRRKR
jgi:cell fate regulator YaaT (PSP1 superfamily)